jgi:hypothetical protein
LALGWDLLILRSMFTTALGGIMDGWIITMGAMSIIPLTCRGRSSRRDSIMAIAPAKNKELLAHRMSLVYQQLDGFAFASMQ